MSLLWPRSEWSKETTPAAWVFLPSLSSKKSPHTASTRDHSASKPSHCLDDAHTTRSVTPIVAPKLINRFLSDSRDVQNNYLTPADAMRAEGATGKWKALIECQREAGGQDELHVMRQSQLMGTPPRLLGWWGGGWGERGRGVGGVSC